MAKASSGADPHVLRIRCNSCGATLKVPKAVAGRFINCPKCEKKTQVPIDQKAADEEARDYGVNKLAYDTTGVCRSCGAKMAKNAVLCLKCGFDYRSGKQVEVVDKTKLPSDYPTWGKIFSALGGDAVTQGLVKILANTVLTGVAVGALGLGTTFTILWFVSDGFETPPAWPWYIGYGIAGIALLILAGLLEETFIEAASKGFYDRPITAGALPVATIYFLATAIPAFILPVLMLCFVAFKATFEQSKEFDALDPGWFDGAPMPTFIWNESSGPLGVGLAILFLAIGLVYFYFGVVSYITDLSVNPMNIFKWIGKSIVDIPAWLGLTLLFLGISVGLTCLIYFGGHSLEIYAPWVNMLTGGIAILTMSYALAAAAHMAGLIAKRHL
jgi:DNA-directed RNA polymerase subunit M/transcription elongation factor TFIIS